MTEVVLLLCDERQCGSGGTRGLEREELSWRASEADVAVTTSAERSERTGSLRPRS